MKTKQLTVMVVLLITLALLLAACQPAGGMPDTGASQTEQPVDAAQTSEPLTGSATETAPGAVTGEATPTPIMTDDPQATATAQAAAVMAAVAPHGKASSNSPDGRWRAEVWRHECTVIGEGEEMAYEELRLVDTRSGQGQVIASQLQYCGGLGAAGLGELSWSRSTRYLYFSTAAGGVPDGGGCGYWQSPLNAYELETGAMTELAQGVVAPGQGVIAYWHRPPYSETGERQETPDLVLWDLDKGEVGRIAPLEASWNRGPLAWSPDGSRLAFIETENDCMPGGESQVVLADPASGETSVVARSAELPFAGLEWTEPGRLTLVDQSHQVYRLDLESGKLSTE